MKNSQKVICFTSATYRNKQNLRNYKQEVPCNFKIETPHLLDVEELSVWITKAYRFDLDDKGEWETVNAVTQAAIQSGKLDT